MFFMLSKTIGFFALPSNLVATLAVVGVILLFTRFRRAGRFLATLGVVLLLLAGLSPLGNMLIYPLEHRFPPWDALRGAPAGLVVLGGAISPDVSAAHDTPALTEAAERITAIAELAKKYPAARIIYSGGNARLLYAQANEADYALQLLESFGIARERLAAEDKSRNTVQNAQFSKALADPKPGERWLLVTSAYHMPRAIGIFRRAGFAVEAYPVDWRTRGRVDLMMPFDSLTAGLRRTDTAGREWVGLAAYWITGQSAALFPAP
jgi:uncharacterized SAM-binding protein YcdF (DUF218 family)